MTAAMVVSAALYHSALNHSVRIDRMHRASRVVERRLEEIRSWSQEEHGTNGPLLFTSGWAAFDDQVTKDAEYPEFSVTTRIIQQDLYSPSSAFEEISFAAQADKNVPPGPLKEQQRQLNNSSFLVEVESRWGPGLKDQFTARTLIADPVKDYGWDPADAYQAIELSNTPASLALDAEVYITAVVKDANGRTVQNAVVQWYIDPDSTGNGTLEVEPERPERAKLINVVRVPRDPDDDADFMEVHTGGSVRVVARIRLGGVEAINKTDPIALAPDP